MNNNIGKPAKKRGRPPGSKNKPKGPVFLDAVQQKITEQKKQSAVVVPTVMPQQKEISKPKEVDLPNISNPPVISTIKKQQTQQPVLLDVSQYKNYKQYQVGDRVRKITDEEIGYVKVHRENTRYVYVDWGGDYMNWVPFDLLQSAPIIPKKHKK